MQASHPVILFLGKCGIRIADAGGHEFRHPSFDQFLRQLRILQLVAYGYAESCPNQFRQIGIQCMEGEPRHLESRRGTTAAIGTVCQRYIEYLGGLDGIFRVGLIEIAATK